MVRVYEAMNYYSASNPQNMKREGDMMGYALGEIVGWKKAGKAVTVRLGSAGWGYRGYADIDLSSGVIETMYSVSLLGYHQLEQ